MDKMINNIKKSCPFCGSNNLSIHRNMDYVQCEICHAAGPMFDGHLKDAIDGWNNQQLNLSVINDCIEVVKKALFVDQVEDRDVIELLESLIKEKTWKKG